MASPSSEEEGFVREWAPYTHMLNVIPTKVQFGIFSQDLNLTCMDAVGEYFALGTNVGLIYWYSRKKGTLQRLRCELTQSAITFVKIANTVDYMVAAGNTNGQVTVFQIPKEHPDSVPDTLKPKKERKVERYTVGEMHKSKITAIEWAKNGMRLFSGDKSGIIIMTEIDFYMHLCKSTEIVNESYEIIQISYYQNSLLISSVYRTIVCEKKNLKWEVSQVGKKDRKSLCSLGAVFHWSYEHPGEVSAYCARPGLRLWRADKSASVLETLLFKDAVSNPTTIAELLNPSQVKHMQSNKEYNFGPLFIFRDKFIVTYNEDILYLLDPSSMTAVAVVDDLRKVLSVSVNKDEILILEGDRSFVRLGYSPDPDLTSPEDPVCKENLLTKSLTNSIQQAVNTVRDLTHIDSTVPYICKVLDRSHIFDSDPFLDGGPADLAVVKAEECFEIPYSKVENDKVLESFVKDYQKMKTVSEFEKLDELYKKLNEKSKLYKTITDKQFDTEVLYSSKRSKKRDDDITRIINVNLTEQLPEQNGAENFSDTVDNKVLEYSEEMKRSLHGNGLLPEYRPMEVIEKEIADNELRLAKLLNLDTLAVKKTTPSTFPNQTVSVAKSKVSEPINKKNPIINKLPVNMPNNADNVSMPLLNSFDKVPHNWNLENLKIVEDTNKSRVPMYWSNLTGPKSPDDTIDSDWEFV